jgi:glycosyltransferase involved in cell wall biosynthesis
MPTVSVCLPVYNGAKYLAQAIESVLAQTCGDFELLIADDRSGDGSADIMNSYARQDKRIQAWTNERNLGHYPNYNACIQRATGKYIKLFAQDDIFRPSMFEQLVSVLGQNENVSLVTAARQWIDADGRQIPTQSEVDTKLTKPFAEDTIIPGVEAIVSTLKESVNWLGEPAAQMFRAKHIDCGFDTSFHQLGDLEYNYRLLQQGNFYFVANELCLFRKHQDSWTTSNNAQLGTHLDWLLLAAKYSKYLAQAGLTSERYCLNFVKNWVRDLECELYYAHRLGPHDREEVLRDMCGKVDPLTLFDYKKRDVSLEFKVLSAMALLQSSLLEHELRLVHDELARPYCEPNPQIEVHITEEELRGNGGKDQAKLSHLDQPMIEVRAGLQAALSGLKETLRERDREIESLRQALNDMGNSASWKMTAPVRKLKGRLKSRAPKPMI